MTNKTNKFPLRSVALAAAALLLAGCAGVDGADLDAVTIDVDHVVVAGTGACPSDDDRTKAAAGAGASARRTRRGR